MTTDTVAAVTAKPGKYLCFTLGRQEYGFELAKVQHIVGIGEVIRAPRAPACVPGVVWIQGCAMPVVDPCRRLGLSAQAETAKTCVVVVRVSRNDHLVDLGVIVNEVSEVLSFTVDQITDVAAMAASPGGSTAITGQGKLGMKAVLLLDAERLLKGVPVTMDSEGKDVL